MELAISGFSIILGGISSAPHRVTSHSIPKVPGKPETGLLEPWPALTVMRTNCTT